MDVSLVQKYNIPGPRYTSYPTVPYWQQQDMGEQEWKQSLIQSYNECNEAEGISIYIHLPFCESLCTFCACHKRITKNHKVEEPYIEAVLKEWRLYCDILPSKPKIKEIHLGGGTPTFFLPDNLERLILSIINSSVLIDNYEFSFEGHPNNTSYNHLKTLYDLGFRRNSFGVQDYDPVVQKTINRMQPFEKVEEVTHWSRDIGYESISHDLVFGLPKQTLDSVLETIHLTKRLKPDRIAFYSYAHVPWIKNVGQRGYNESDLPPAEVKRAMYESGKELLGELGYEEIGMDHFALQTDSLYKAFQQNALHRNFMGYTTNTTQVMIGLGMSAISDSWYSFAQNIKSVEEYMDAVDNGIIPIFKGHHLSKKDLIVRKHILDIMCHFTTSWKDEHMQFPELEDCLNRLKEMESDGLVIIDRDQRQLYLPEHARPFVRNVCMAFDLHLINNKPETRIFSMTI